MTTSIVRRFTVLAAALAASPLPSQAQRAPASVERWAAAHAIPLRADALDTATADLSAVASIVGSARVVAFGEPTHGTHEPLAQRNRLSRLLVERMSWLTRPRPLHANGMTHVVVAAVPAFDALAVFDTLTASRRRSP